MKCRNCKLRKELKKTRHKLYLAKNDLYEIMFRGGGNIDTCEYCTNVKCYGRGGTYVCNPEWRGLKWHNSTK